MTQTFLILDIILLLIIALFLFLTTKIATIRGVIGEWRIKKLLATLPAEKYTMRHDIMIEVDGRTTQIDHLVISEQGVFVIETKNCLGIVFGNERQAQWTHKNSHHKRRLQNPVRQNYGHIKSLETVLERSSDDFISIVVFNDRVKLRIENQETTIQNAQLIGKILSYQEQRITNADMKTIIEAIDANNIVSKSSRKQHTIKIKEKLADNQRQVQAGICPKCGGKLINKEGKYGAFQGCSSFPKCRYTAKNISA